KSADPAPAAGQTGEHVLDSLRRDLVYRVESNPLEIVEAETAAADRAHQAAFQDIAGAGEAIDQGVVESASHVGDIPGEAGRTRTHLDKQAVDAVIGKITHCPRPSFE